MYGIKEVRDVFEYPSYQVLFNTPWLGEARKGDKPQISELKLRKKKLRTESTEKHSNDNNNTRVLNVCPGIDYRLSTNHEEIPGMKTTGMNYGPRDL